MKAVPHVRAARPEELPGIIELTDQTFCPGYPGTMGRVFAHMLCEANIENVRTIVIDGKPAAVLGIFRSRIDLEGSVIDAASIGAVCTDPEYRMRGFASALMDDALRRITRDRVDLLLISGRQNIYLQRGCTVVGNFDDCVLDQRSGRESRIELREMGDADVGDAVRIHSREAVKFCRTYDEFRMLLDNSTLDRMKYTFRKYVVPMDGKIAAYIILRLTNGPAPAGMIVEYAGERSLVCEALTRLVQMHGISRLVLHLPDADPLLGYLRTAGAAVGTGTQEGSVRIMSFSGLMAKLGGYFERRLPKSLVTRLTFSDRRGRWVISDGEEAFETADISAVTRLIFEGSDSVPEAQSVDKDSALGRFLRAAFPIPFPSAKSMNYI